MKIAESSKITKRVTNRITDLIATQPLSILVADDDPWMLELMKRHLRMLNHRVVGSATNGQETIVLAKELQPELVILDLNMPVIDGIQAACAIQATQNASIILSTGAADEATLNRLRDLKIGAYLVKPFSPAQLRAAIYVATFWHRQPMAAAGAASGAGSALPSQG